MNKTSFINSSKQFQIEDEENYEDLINIYLSERHLFSASLPPPTLTDSLIDQIQSENHQKLQEKLQLKFNLKQSLLQLINPSLCNSPNLSQRAIESQISEPMIEIVEVTSSDEQSPITKNQFDPSLNECFSDSEESCTNISQEIKYLIFRPNDKKSIPVMNNRFFPISEKFQRNKERMMKIMNCSKMFREQKELKCKAKEFLEDNPNKVYAVVFSPVNRNKVGMFLIHNEKAVKIFGDELPDCIPLCKINRKYTFDFSDCNFLENSAIIDGFDFNEELLS